MTRSRSFCDSNQLKKIEIAHFSQKKFQKSLKCGCKYYLSKWQHLFTTANASFGCMHAHNYAILNHLFIFIIIYLERKLKRKYNLKIMLNEHWAVRVYTKCDELASKRWILGGICRQNTDNQASFEKKTKQTSRRCIWHYICRFIQTELKIKWKAAENLNHKQTNSENKHNHCDDEKHEATQNMLRQNVRALELPIFNSKHFNAMPMLVRYRWNSNTTEYTHRTHIVY